MEEPQLNIQHIVHISFMIGLYVRRNNVMIIEMVMYEIIFIVIILFVSPVVVHSMELGVSWTIF
jgi:hypothetical protein